LGIYSQPQADALLQACEESSIRVQQHLVRTLTDGIVTETHLVSNLASSMTTGT